MTKDIRTEEQKLINKFYLALEGNDYFLMAILKKRLEAKGYRVEPIESKCPLVQSRQDSEKDRRNSAL